MPKIVENALVIYTDGSLYPKGRKGGYGMVFVHVNEIGEETIVREESPPGIQGVTNNRMELQASIDALTIAPEIECFPSVGKVVIRTDSSYVKNHYNLALGAWRKQRWCNRDGKPVDNADLWKDFVGAYGKVRKPKLVEWIKGHGKGIAKNVHNIRADTLAKQSANNPLSRKVFLSSVRRKVAPGRTRAGSVRLFGQTMVVHVVEAKWMGVQRVWKYRYQVLSPESGDRYAIDWIYSKEHMRDGHFYEVQVNDNMRHPQILQVLRHVERSEAMN